MRSCVCAWLFTCAVFASSSAAAVDSTASPAPSSAPSPGPGDGASPAAGPFEPSSEGETVRIRAGASGIGGPALGGLHAGGAGGIQARVGAQITRWAAVYAQPVMLVVDARDRIPSGGPVSGWFYGAGAIGEVTIADVVYLGGGPELLDGRTQPPWTEGYPRGSGATSGPYLSMTGRSGFYLFGEMTPKRRQAFTLGVDVRTIFNEGDTIVLPCLGIGYEAF